MTDRYSAFIVMLDRDIREDDAEEGILTALRMLKGVVSVQPVHALPISPEALRRDQKWRSALLTLLKEGPELIKGDVE